MSVWSHVTGSIRLDSFEFLVDINIHQEERIKKIIGPMCLFEDWNEESNLPRGSEGSIEYAVYSDPEEHSLAKYNIVFWGDLRDFDSNDCKEIDAWFKELVEEKFSIKETLLTVRDAVLKYSTEYEDDKQHILYLDKSETPKILKVDI